MGYITRRVPVDHPDFGKAFPCVCQREAIAARKSSRSKALSNLEGLATKTFDTFDLNRPGLNADHFLNLQTSYNLAESFARKPQGWLLFQGGYGSGKTHLAAAIANYQIGQGNQVIFTTTPDLLDHLRATYGPSSEVEYDDLFMEIRNVPLLILDDLGTESPTSWAQEKLYQLINHRYTQKLPTVITTNFELSRIDPRIRSRLLDKYSTKIANMYVPDYRWMNAESEQNELSNFNLYGEMLFSKFDFRQGTLTKDEQRNLRNAYDLAYEYAENPEGWLAFLGEHGCGKTHLAAAIAFHRRNMGETVLFVTTPDLLDYLRAAFDPSAHVSFDKRFNELKRASLLVIDNLNLNNASKWALEKLQQIIDYRYLTLSPTVFTTAHELETIDPFIRSRLSDVRCCRVFGIKAPDYMGGSQPTRR